MDYRFLNLSRSMATVRFSARPLSISSHDLDIGMPPVTHRCPGPTKPPRRAASAASRTSRMSQSRADVGKFSPSTYSHFHHKTTPLRVWRWPLEAAILELP